MESRIDEFRTFVRKYPRIKDDVKNGLKTWQSLYEDWVLLGEEDSVWDIYKEVKKDSDLGNKKLDDLLTTSNIKNIVGVALQGDPQTRTIHETQSKEDKMKEYMLLSLRKIEGVKISDFKNKFVDNPIYIYRESLNKLVTQELIEIDIDSIKLTNKGLDLANIVWEEFV